MKKFALLIISIIPIFLFGLYIYQKDKEKESTKLLTKLFIYGIISCFPAAILSTLIASFFPSEKTMNSIVLFVYVFISVGLVEEVCKWIMVYKISYNNKEFDQMYDAIVYSVYVSLGFACFENILYVLDGGLTVGLMRAVLSIPCHVCFGILMGDYLALAKESGLKHCKTLEKKNLIISIILPSVVHTLYDYFLSTNDFIFIFTILFAILVVCIYIYSIKKVNKVAKTQNNLFQKHFNFCQKCGTKAYGNYCVVCGEKLFKNEINNK